jgi:kynurenine 3-monooxygenase
MVKKVVIVGAGASGLLLAHYLLNRSDQYQVEIYELRDNPQISPFSKSRTFPIALNNTKGYLAVKYKAKQFS